MDPVTILTAFIPLLQSGAKALIKKISGKDSAAADVVPQTVDDAIKLGELDIRRLESIASLDSVSGASTWVSNVRGIQRPAAVLVVLTTYAACVFNPDIAQSTLDMVANLASSAMFYLFGDRTLMYLNGRKGGNQ